MDLCKISIFNKAAAVGSDISRKLMGCENAATIQGKSKYFKRRFFRICFKRSGSGTAAFGAFIADIIGRNRYQCLYNNKRIDQ